MKHAKRAWDLQFPKTVMILEKIFLLVSTNYKNTLSFSVFPCNPSFNSYQENLAPKIIFRECIQLFLGRMKHAYVEEMNLQMNF